MLRDAHVILAEDTRTTRHLLGGHGIRRRLLSYTEHNHAARLPQILALLDDGDVALVSEAGMPGINDPGQALVAATLDAGHRVVGLPGPSAVPLAIAVSGFPARSFTFLGFLPHKATERRRVLTTNADSGHVLVCFESPHRLVAALGDIDVILHDRRLAVCRELTKLHEEIFHGTAHDALAHFTEPRGEFTLVIEAGTPVARQPADQDELRQFLHGRAAAGDSARDAVAGAVTRFGVSRRSAYRVWQEMRAAAVDV